MSRVDGRCKNYMKNRKNVDVLWIDFVNRNISKLQRNKYSELYDGNISSYWTQILCVSKVLICNSKSSTTIVHKQFMIQLACVKTTC